MSEHYLYLTVDIACIIVPLIAGFHKRLPFAGEWRSILPAIGITAIIFIVWDSHFSRLGVWHFNPRYITGLNLFHLPVEEVLFFVCIPYPCLFLYYCVEKFIKPKASIFVNAALSALAMMLLLIALTHRELLYTCYTFLFLAFLLALLLLSSREAARLFLISFSISLLPFFISNGILTGLWTDEPVVIYNDSYNLKLRITTIPVEDLFYGMAFQLMNVLLFVRFRRMQSSNFLRRRNKGFNTEPGYSQRGDL